MANLTLIATVFFHVYSFSPTRQGGLIPQRKLEQSRGTGPWSKEREVYVGLVLHGHKSCLWDQSIKFICQGLVPQLLENSFMPSLVTE